MHAILHATYTPVALIRNSILLVSTHLDHINNDLYTYRSKHGVEWIEVCACDLNQYPSSNFSHIHTLSQDLPCNVYTCTPVLRPDECCIKNADNLWVTNKDTLLPYPPHCNGPGTVHILQCIVYSDMYVGCIWKCNSEYNIIHSLK